jgi:hypothetical protein
MADRRIDYLLELMNNKTTFRNRTGDNKKSFKYVLTCIFINIINGKDHEWFKRYLYQKAEFTKA